MISNLQPNEKKEHVRLDTNWVKFIRRIMQLGDGRYMLTITKSGVIIDLTVTEMGKVERLN